MTRQTATMRRTARTLRGGAPGSRTKRAALRPRRRRGAHRIALHRAGGSVPHDTTAPTPNVTRGMVALGDVIRINHVEIY